MESITIKDFKGVNLKEGLWEQGFSGYATNVDIYGLGDDPNFESYPGVLQGGLNIQATTISASGTFSALMYNFALYPTDNQIYGITIDNPGKIYRYNAGTQWQNVSAVNVSAAGRNLLGYNGNLYYATSLYVGQYDGTNGNATWHTLTGGFSNPVALKKFAGSMFVGHNRYVDKYDGTSYTDGKLTLPSEFTIRSMEVFRDNLYISADDGKAARIFIWDGISPTYLDQILLESEKYGPSLIQSVGLLWVVGNRGAFSNKFSINTPIYVYDFSSLQYLFSLPIARDSSFSPECGLATYQGGILIGSNEGANPVFENGIGGVWYIGKDLATGLYHAVDMWYVFGTPHDQTVGGIYSSGGNPQNSAPGVFIAIDTTLLSTNDYEVWQVLPTQASSTINLTPHWQSLPIDAGSTQDKSWTYMKCNFDALTTGQSVEISYALNDATSFIILKTFTASDPASDRMQYIPIGRTARTIRIRIVMNTTAGHKHTRFHSFTLYYEPTGN